MSTAQWIVELAVTALFSGGAVVFAYLAWQVAKRQLNLAEQRERELRPELEVSRVRLVKVEDVEGLQDDIDYVLTKQKEEEEERAR